MKSAIIQTVDKVLRAHGFSKSGATWHRDEEETTLVVNLQKSQYSDKFYVNLAVWLKALGNETNPKEHKCHIRGRLDAVAGDAAETLFDCENTTLSDVDRAKAIESSLTDHAIPFLLECRSVALLNKQLKRGKLNRFFVVKEVNELVVGRP
jgi:hypothetical protein